MTCPIDPEGTKCVVVPDQIAEKSKGGIWLAPEARDEHQTAVTHGTLAALGPRAEVCWNDGQKPQERPAQVGDRIIFVKYGGTVIRWGDKVFQILQDQDIIGLMLEEPPITDFTYKDSTKNRILVPGR